MENGARPVQQVQEDRIAELDLEANVREEQLKNSKGLRLWVLIYQSIGIVYGGLGTSPLYVYPNVFSSTPTPDDVLGTMSLIFWTLTIIVILKYVSLVLHANDKGEGGTIAMYSLLCRHARISAFNQIPEGEDAAPADGILSDQESSRPKRAKWLERSKPLQKALLGIVLLGTAFMFCDGILSPSASVVSAMAGAQVINPNLSNEAIAGMSCAILLALFSVQRFGTAKLGMAFSPVLLIWFLGNGAIGIYNIARYMPDVFKAILPHYAFKYFLSSGRASWVSLTGVVLCISGSEATYADMGHFSHRAITIGTLGLVYPSLLLIYFGETAYLASFPDTYAQSYFKSIPEPLFWPFFIIAMASALVGSQSLITSAFSIVRQSAVLSCFPPVRVVHTGKEVEGQIYIPEVNWLLCILGIAFVAGFRDITAIGNAFGLVVVMVMVIITILITVVMLIVWDWHLVPVFAISAALLFIEGAYLSAVLYKVPQGGWFPLVVAAVVLCIAATWHWGSLLRLRHSRTRSHSLVEDLLRESDAPSTTGKRLVLARGNGMSPMALDVSLQSGNSISRVPGIAVYLAEHAFGLPSGFVHVLETLGVVHHTVIFLTVQKVPLPAVPPEQRFGVRQLDMPGFYRALCRTGYTDTLVRDAAFLDGLLQCIVQAARYKALAAKWSAGEIYSRSPSRDGGILSTAVLRRKSRSMRNIVVPPAVQQEASIAAASGQQQLSAGKRSLSCSAERQVMPEQSSEAHMEQRQRSESSMGAAGCTRDARKADSAIELPDISMQAGDNAQSKLADHSSSAAAASESTSCHISDGRPGPPNDTIEPGEPPKNEAGSAEEASSLPSPRAAAEQDAATAETFDTYAAQLSFRGARAALSGDSEAAAILASRTHGLTFVMARYVLRATQRSNWLRRLLVENVYGTLRSISYDANESWCAVHERVLDVRITYHV